MARSTAGQADPAPQMPELLFHASACWRAIRDTRTEADPFGQSFAAPGEARASLEALARHCAGPSGSVEPVDGPEPPAAGPPEGRAGATR